MAHGPGLGLWLRMGQSPLQLPLEAPPITADVLLTRTRRPEPAKASPSSSSSGKDVGVAVLAAIAVVLALSALVPELAPGQPSPAPVAAPAFARSIAKLPV